MLDKKDISILDNIIDKLISTTGAINYRLFSKHEHFTKINPRDKVDEFQRLIDILRKYDLVHFHYANIVSSITANQNTRNFKENGGFSKIYQDELNRIEKENVREQIELDLAKSNLEANELNKSIAAKNEIDKKKNRTERIINIYIGVLNLILLVVQVLLSLCKS